MVVILANAASSLLHAVKRGQGVMHRPDHKAESPKKFRRAQVWQVPTHGLDEASHHGVELDGENIIHTGQRLNQGASEKPHKVAASLGVIGSQFKERAGHYVDDLIHTHRLPPRLLFRLGQCFQPGFIDGAQAPGQNLGIKCLLVPQMVVRRGKIHPGIARDIAQRRPIESVLGEQLLR